MNWKDFIYSERKKNYFIDLIEFVQKDAKEHTIYPDHTNIFNAFRYTSITNTKVIILGADPYHGPNQAHGLAFSVQLGVDIPPSLHSIYTELVSDVGVSMPTHGCLVKWAEQGVLLLNSALTVRRGQAGSHSKMWEPFTDTAISLLDSLENPLVFMLWGSHAKKKKDLIFNKHHLILETVHPSPLSAYRGFFGCKHFSKCNDFLIKNNIQPIDWSIT